MNLKDAILPFGERIHTGTPDSILSGLYRDILLDLGIPETRFLVNINKYVMRTTGPEDMKEISSIRGNLRKELMRSVMTWKVFVKGLKVLNIRRFDIGVHLIREHEVSAGGEDRMSEAAVMRGVILDPSMPKGEKDVNKPDTVIATLFHDAMFTFNVGTKYFMELIAEYIIKANIPINMKEVSSTRGNLKKELFKPSITWKVFIKGLMFLKVKKFDFAIYLHHPTGKVTQHTRTVILDPSYINQDILSTHE